MNIKSVKHCWDCSFCFKSYSSQSSLGNHKRKFHKKMDKENVKENVKKINKSLTCEYCKKVFTFRSQKSYHKKICKEEKKEEDNKKVIYQQQNITNNNHSNNSNNNVNSNNITNNYITYNFNSKEDKDRIPYILDDDTKYKLMLEPYYNVIPKLIEIIYCGNYIQFKNVLVTNLQNNIAYYYENGKFIAGDKKQILNTLINNNYVNIKNIAEDVKKMSNVKNTKKIIIKNNKKEVISLVEQINNSVNNLDKKYKKDEVIKEEELKNIKHKSFKDYNRKLIVFLLHKHKDEIKNKCALISDKELTEDEIEMMIEKKKEMELCYNKNICEYEYDEDDKEEYEKEEYEKEDEKEDDE